MKRPTGPASPRASGERSSPDSRGRGERQRKRAEPGHAGSPGPSPGRSDERLDLSPQAGRGGLVFLGEFGRAHGLAGEVRLKSHTEDPRAVGRYGALTSDTGRIFTLTSLRQAAGDQPDLLVVRVEGVTTREAAEALNRTRLYVPRESLGAPADEDEFFLSDLIGLLVEGPNGPLGHVIGVPDYGSGELLEIAPTGGGRSFLLPFTKRHVPVIDIAGGVIRADPPEGLIEPARDGLESSHPREADAESET